MRNYLVISMLAAGLALPAMAAAQTRSVDDYVCTFAGTCPTDEAEAAEEQAPAAAGERRGRTSSTRGFSLARPGATASAAAPASVKSTARKAPPAKPAAASSSSSGAQQLAPSGVSLPTIPKRPPVCSVPPAMRFCKVIDYPVYRPDEDHTFAELDFDSHAVFKKIVPHMRISERHFELPVIHQVSAQYAFVCLGSP